MRAPSWGRLLTTGDAYPRRRARHARPARSRRHPRPCRPGLCRRPPVRAVPVATLGPAPGRRGPCRALPRNGKSGRDRRQVQHAADEVAQRQHQLGGVDRAPFGQLGGGAGGQLHLFVGTEQQDVRQRRLDRIADASRPVGAGDRASRRLCRGHCSLRFAMPAQVAQMDRVYRKVAGERPAERLVRRDQAAQPLVDLPVFALVALLHGLHREQADAYSEQGDQHQAEQRRPQRVPGAEIEIAHAVTPESPTRTASVPARLQRKRRAVSDRGMTSRTRAPARVAAASFHHRSPGMPCATPFSPPACARSPPA